MARARVLLVFLKAPVPGRVKTRLAAALGPEGAARAYREMAAAIAAELGRLRGIEVRWLYEPASEFPDLAWLGLPEAAIRRQTDGDLGRRLRAAFSDAFAGGAGPVCVIGMDSPGLPAARIEEAFRSLRDADAALIPVEDGGYCLLGMKEFRPELLERIDWSTERVFAQTEARAREEGLRLRVFEPYFDVDTLEEYERWKKQLQ